MLVYLSLSFRRIVPIKEEAKLTGQSCISFNPYGGVAPVTPLLDFTEIFITDVESSFVGGFNIGDEYLGKVKKWGYWRDAAVRIEGNAALACQLRFFFDWNYAAKGERQVYQHRYFPDIAPSSGAAVQVVSGGPDTYWNPIKEAYLKMINSATESAYLQTPYFIPDDSVRDALRIAALSGIDVRIMIPNRPDHPFVYWAGLSFVGLLLESGVRGYTSVSYT